MPTPPSSFHNTAVACLQELGQLGHGEGGQVVQPALQAARQLHLRVLKRDLDRVGADDLQIIGQGMEAECSPCDQ